MTLTQIHRAGEPEINSYSNPSQKAPGKRIEHGFALTVTGLPGTLGNQSPGKGLGMAKNTLTDTVIRITTKHGSMTRVGPQADGTHVVTIQCVRSEFGKPGIKYTLRINADVELPAQFDIRNGKTGQYLGVWAVIDESVNATLWDATDVPAEAAKRNAARTAPSATLSVAPAVPAMLSGLIATGRTSSVTTRRIQPIGAFRA
jgi:hypothetical protein